MDELYLDNLDEFIKDEGRIVTYKWLSITLNVSSNIAKQMLFHYVSKQKESPEHNSKITVTYLVSGMLYNDDLKQDIHTVCVVRDSELDGLKKKLKKISSLHIYSIQKSQLRDLNSLYLADYSKVTEDVFEATKHSGITCPSVQIRSADDINKLNNELAYIPARSPLKSNARTSKPPLGKNQENGTENKENKFSEETVRVTETKKNIVTKGSRSAIASMFANQVKKAEKTAVDAKVECSNTSSEKKPNITQGPLASFFSKNIIHKTENCAKETKLTTTKIQSEEQESKLCGTTVSENHKEVTKEKSNVSKINIDNGDICDSSKDVRTPPNVVRNLEQKKPTRKTKTVETNKKNGKSKRKAVKNNSEADLKRRRIMTLDSSSESSSSEEEDDMMDENPIPSPPHVAAFSIQSDDEEVIPLTPQRESVDVTNMSRCKRRKLVDSTYQSEDGFLVTNKEYVITSDFSDDEDPLVGLKAEQKPKSPKKIKESPKKANKRSPVKTEQKPKSPKKIKESPKKANKRSPVKTEQKPKSPKKIKESPKKVNKRSPVKSKQSSITTFFKKKV